MASGMFAKYKTEIEAAVKAEELKVPSDSNYIARVASLEPQVTKNTNLDCLVWTLIVQGGQYHGAKLVSRSFFHTEQSAGITLRTLKNAGCTGRTPEEIEAQVPSIPGRFVEIRVVDQKNGQGQNVFINKVVPPGEVPPAPEAPANGSGDDSLPELDDDLPF